MGLLPGAQSLPAAPHTEREGAIIPSLCEIFGRVYLHHLTLSNALAQFRKKKAQLLRVLEFPELPLHNNEAESDIREFVIRSKISGGPRSEVGRKARDTMVGLKKICRKLGVCFWEFLLSRVRGEATIAPLAALVLQKLQETTQTAQAA